MSQGTRRPGPDPLSAFVECSLDRRAAPGIRRLAGEIAGRPGVAAVLFYGNMARDPAAAGLVDLYVLTDHDRAWAGIGLAAAGNRLLPPNVYHLALEDVAAKVAVIRLAAFQQRMRRDSWDTTLWARFAQPAALLHARDDAARAAVVGAVAQAWRTAAWWADRLAPGEDRWAGLFAATYGAELRPEGAGRPGAIAAAAPDLYAGIDALLPRMHLPQVDKDAARRAWARRRRAGLALNTARLLKAATTFRGGTAYALSKIERHAGPAALRPWQRRLPWLAAPLVLLRLLRRGGLR